MAPGAHHLEGAQLAAPQAARETCRPWPHARGNIDGHARYWAGCWLPHITHEGVQLAAPCRLYIVRRAGGCAGRVRRSHPSAAAGQNRSLYDIPGYIHTAHSVLPAKTGMCSALSAAYKGRHVQREPACAGRDMYYSWRSMQCWWRCCCTQRVVHVSPNF
jgi:hypothetical protein